MQLADKHLSMLIWMRRWWRVHSFRHLVPVAGEIILLKSPTISRVALSNTLGLLGSFVVKKCLIRTNKRWWPFITRGTISPRTNKFPMGQTKYKSDNKQVTVVGSLTLDNAVHCHYDMQCLFHRFPSQLQSNREMISEPNQ